MVHGWGYLPPTRNQVCMWSIRQILGLQNKKTGNDTVSGNKRDSFNYFVINNIRNEKQNFTTMGRKKS